MNQPTDVPVDRPRPVQNPLTLIMPIKSENDYHVDWEGTRAVQKDAMNSPGKN